MLTSAKTLPGIWEPAVIPAKSTTSRMYVEALPKTSRFPAKKTKPIHKIQQSNNESGQNSQDDIGRHIVMVNIMYLSYHSIKATIITKLKPSYIQNRAKIEHKAVMAI